MTVPRSVSVHVVPLDTSSLGDRSYVVHDGTVAVVVDPQRDIDRVLALTDDLGVRVTHVVETHIHNDYVTGGLALARATGATYVVHADDAVGFDRLAVRDGDVITVSARLSLRVVATPGHTHTHLSYVIDGDDGPVGVCTGGSLLFGSTGRPDLLGPEHTEELVHAQYHSAHRLAAELPDEVAVFPTHGFGSFCAATQTEGTASTIGHEKQVNLALTVDQRTFVERTLAGLDVWPAYYAHMGPANLAGPDGPDLSLPTLVDGVELRHRVERGEWVVDLRSRTAFAAGHVPGTLAFGLDGSFATYLGWFIPWGTPLTLIGETAEQVTEAQRELVRIGIDRPAGAAVGRPTDLSGARAPAALRLATLAELAAARDDRPIVVLDVRRDLEWATGHVAGAVHIPLHQLLDRITEIPEGEVWVQCQSGYRAAVAASMLLARGRRAVAVDDEFEKASDAGLELVPGSRMAA